MSEERLGGELPLRVGGELPLRLSEHIGGFHVCPKCGRRHWLKVDVPREALVGSRIFAQARAVAKIPLFAMYVERNPAGWLVRFETVRGYRHIGFSFSIFPERFNQPRDVVMTAAMLMQDAFMDYCRQAEYFDLFDWYNLQNKELSAS